MWQVVLVTTHSLKIRRRKKPTSSSDYYYYQNASFSEPLHEDNKTDAIVIVSKPAPVPRTRTPLSERRQTPKPSPRLPRAQTTTPRLPRKPPVHKDLEVGKIKEYIETTAAAEDGNGFDVEFKVCVQYLSNICGVSYSAWNIARSGADMPCKVLKDHLHSKVSLILIILTLLFEWFVCHTFLLHSMTNRLCF